MAAEVEREDLLISQVMVELRLEETQAILQASQAARQVLQVLYLETDRHMEAAAPHKRTAKMAQ
jgi:hypothetical protein